jgi:hypothetical protein
MATTVQAKCTDMPSAGRSTQAPGLATRPGSPGAGGCSFSLPLRPSCISPVTQGLLQNVADGLGGGAHTPADMRGWGWGPGGPVGVQIGTICAVSGTDPGDRAE